MELTIVDQTGSRLVRKDPQLAAGDAGSRPLRGGDFGGLAGSPGGWLHRTDRAGHGSVDPDGEDPVSELRR